MRRALFLDRDGVINIDRGYVCTQDQFEFIEGIFDLCRHSANLGYLIVVITNQAGIGRGYYSEREFQRLTEWMCAAFADRGAPIAKVYHCPFHPEFGIGAYKLDSDCRKPGPGMILQAAKEFDIDLRRSTLVGDRETDIQAGRAAGVGTNVLYWPHANPFRTDSSSIATATIRNLVDAVPLLGLDLAEEDLRRKSCIS